MHTKNIMLIESMTRRHGLWRIRRPL